MIFCCISISIINYFQLKSIINCVVCSFQTCPLIPALGLMPSHSEGGRVHVCKSIQELSVVIDAKLGTLTKYE